MFFEEPPAPDRIDAYTRLNYETEIPIPAGECWALAPEFRRAANAGAVDVLQPDVTGAGGFTSTRRATEIGDAAGLATYPNVFGSAVALAASLQFVATLSGDPRVEFDRTPNPIRAELAVDSIRNEGTSVPVPDGPGLGVERDHETIDRLRTDA